MKRLTVLILSTFIASPFAAGAIVHVDDSATGANDGSTWTNAFVHLADGLAAAQAGDEVWIAQGTYRPDLGAGKTPGDRDEFFTLASGARMYGGFAGTETTLGARAGLFIQTTLSGDLLADDLPNHGNRSDNSRRVMELLFADDQTVLDGFRIRGGNGTVPGSEMTGSGLRLRFSSPAVRSVFFVDNEAEDGGGAYVNSGSPVLDGCVFLGNRATDFGGGLYTGGTAGHTTVLDCDFLFNTALENIGGGMYAVGRVTVREARFERNEAKKRGGGAFVVGGEADLGPTGPLDRLTDCTFVENATFGPNSFGGGLYTVGDPLLVRCSFFGNEAVHGGAFHALSPPSSPASHPTLVGCLFSGNVATGDGGGVHGDAAHVRMHGCTVAGNVAGAAGGGVYVEGVVDVDLTNGVYYGNTAASGFGESAQIHATSQPAVSVHHSCVQGWTGGFGGAGNHGLDPQFLDADGPDGYIGTDDDDLTLAPMSPCIDAGDNAAVFDDWTDLDEDGVLAEPTPWDRAGLPRFADVITVVDTGAGLSPPIVDMGAHEAPGVPRVCQEDLGFQGPGDVRLSICGQDLTLASSTAAFELRDAPPNAPLWLIVGTQSSPTPTNGGVLVPDLGAPYLVFLLTADSEGGLAFPVPATGIPATVYVQVAADAGGAYEFSNALKATF